MRQSGGDPVCGYGSGGAAGRAIKPTLWINSMLQKGVCQNVFFLLVLLKSNLKRVPFQANDVAMYIDETVPALAELVDLVAA